MSSLIFSILGFLLAIGILVTVHEFGHFWVARRFGIKVLRFSIGFGRPFFRWYDKYGTEYVLSYLPFGGYVALFGERSGNISETEKHLAFYNKPVWIRLAVLFAGPFFNLGFAILAYWLMFMIGISSFAPILGHVPAKSPADLAGLRQGQEIVAVDNIPTRSWEAVSVQLLSKFGDHKTVSIETKEIAKEPGKESGKGIGKEKGKETEKESVKDSGEKTSIHTLDINEIENGIQESDVLKELGLVQRDPIKAEIGKLLPDYPAAEAGMQVGDTIISIDKHPISSRSDASEYIQNKMDKPIVITVLRDHQQKEIPIKPVERTLEDGKQVGFIGVLYNTHLKPSPEFVRTVRYGPITAFTEASKRTWDYVIITFSMLKKMLLGKVSVKHLSGPITIAQYAGYTVSIGIEYFLSFLALVSISLGVLNLLPIPLLDGGHIMYCFWELITGKAVSAGAQAVGFWIGGIIILTITMIAIYNDIARF